MTGYPPIHSPERPVRPGWSLRRLALVLVLGSAACSTPAPSPLGSRSPAARTPTPIPFETESSPVGDTDGLVVLSGGVLSIGTADGELVGIDEPDGQVAGFSAVNGRIVVRTAGPAFAVANIEHGGSSVAWQPIEIATTEGQHWLSGPTVSPDGNLLAFAAADPGTTGSFQVVVLDLRNGTRTSQSFDRESNGPPVWIDDDRLLVEVLPIAGGTRFLVFDVATRQADAVRADGFGPSIGGDGSLLAVAATDGSVVAVRTADWLAGKAQDEGAIIDASGHPFGLAVDGTGQRIAIGYADQAGDPASIAIFVREGGGWRRSTTPVAMAPGTPTVLGWLR
jgi:hypothetical protein